MWMVLYKLMEVRLVLSFPLPWNHQMENGLDGVCRTGQAQPPVNCMGFWMVLAYFYAPETVVWLFVTHSQPFMPSRPPSLKPVG